MSKDYEKEINDLLEELKNTVDHDKRDIIRQDIEALKKEQYENLTAWDRVCIARDPKRPKAMDFINALIDNFIEMHGDQLFADDMSVVTGIGFFKKMPITVIAECKGKTTDENIQRNFGMVNPEGYRKALRAARQAEKFRRPILTIVDTAGAYPGKGAEERGQARAIAECLAVFSDLKTPVIALVISEGGSGGALALSVADRIVMLENAIYSILSPEGFASILWKDETRYKEAAEAMKLTAKDLKNKKIVDKIIEENYMDLNIDFETVIKQISSYLDKEFKALLKEDNKTLVSKRYEKFRRMGN